MQINLNPTFHIMCFVLVLPWSAGLAVAERAHAAEKSAIEFITPTVSHHQFAMIVQQLELQPDQRMILQVAFDEYLETLEETYQEADHAADEVGRRIVLDALSGRRIVDLDEFRQRRLDVLKVYAQYQPDADVHLEFLLSSVRSILMDDQRGAFAEPERRLRRELYLHPLHASRHAYEYAGEGVDILRLVEDAMREGEDLEPIDAAQLADVLEEYEQQLDTLLTEYGPGMRSAKMSERIARVARDEEARREAEREILALWQRLYDLNLKTVDKIGGIVAAELGDDAAEQWVMRFDRSCFAWLSSKQMVDRQYEWIMRQSIDADLRRQIEAAYEHYQHARWEKSLEAIDLMLRARRTHKRIIYPMMNPTELDGQVLEIHRRLLRHSGAMAALDASASAELESLLSDHQRTALRRAIRPRGGR